MGKKEKDKAKKKQEKVSIFDAVRYFPTVEDGLSNDQIDERIEQGLVNVVEDNHNSIFKIICKNFFTFFNMMYLVIFILLVTAKVPISNFLFVVIVLFNLLIGTVQEIRAKMMIDKLNLISQSDVFVVRNSKLLEIDRTEIVLDDIMKLSAGQEITSDCILVSGDVEVNESQLTGESVSIRKQIGEMLYSGSIIVSGNCFARVERIGKENQIEKLSQEAKVLQKPNSEIFKSLNMLLRVVAIIIIPLAVIMVYMTYNSLDINVQTGLPYTAFEKYCLTVEKTSGALLGMIPSGLYLLTSMTLAYGVVKLSRHKTLVHDIYCIEMLARVDVLCLDKTGTITDGTMNVTRYIEYGKRGEYNVTEIVGSMNAALDEKNFTAKALENYFGFSKKLVPTNVAPFSSENKYSAVTFEGKGTFVLGAPEFVLKGNFSKIEDEVNEYANQGLRVLALAHSPYELKEGKVQKLPKLVALILIEDQIRKDAIETIKYFKDNDVEVKIISGDNPLTVAEVARRVGVENAEYAISLDGLSDDEVWEMATKYTVFGRVKPNQKQIIVKALKAAKKTVAMTGDGVNDILALKEADCSVAMASGCEAVKNVAQLVLLDSNFNAMPRIVGEGRRVINNIQQTSMLFLVKTLFVMLLSLLFVFGFFKHFSPAGGVNTFPISPSQLILVELFAIGIPAFFLALQPNYQKISGSFLTNVIKRALPGALAVGIEVMATYILSKSFALNALEVSTIVIIVITVTCMMILYIACRPFNIRKVFLFTLMSICCAFIIFASTTAKTYAGINFQQQFKLFDIIDEEVLKPVDVEKTGLPGTESLMQDTELTYNDKKVYKYRFELTELEKSKIFDNNLDDGVMGLIVNISNGTVEYTGNVETITIYDQNKNFFDGTKWIDATSIDSNFSNENEEGYMTVYFADNEEWEKCYAMISYEENKYIIDATSLLLAVALSQTSYIIIVGFNYFASLVLDNKKKEENVELVE